MQPSSGEPPSRRPRSTAVALVLALLTGCAKILSLEGYSVSGDAGLLEIDSSVEVADGATDAQDDDGSAPDGRDADSEDATPADDAGEPEDGSPAEDAAGLDAGHDAAVDGTDAQLPDAAPDPSASGEAGADGDVPPSPFEIASIEPAEGQALSGTQQQLRVTFSTQPRPQSINETSFAVYREGVRVPGTLEVEGSVATFTPSALWVLGVPYSLSLTAEITGSDGQPLSAHSGRFFGPLGTWGTSQPLAEGVNFGSITNLALFTGAAGRSTLAWSGRSGKGFGVLWTRVHTPELGWGALRDALGTGTDQATSGPEGVGPVQVTGNFHGHALVALWVTGHSSGSLNTSYFDGDTWTNVPTSMAGWNPIFALSLGPNASANVLANWVPSAGAPIVGRSVCSRVSAGFSCNELTLRTSDSGPGVVVGSIGLASFGPRAFGAWTEQGALWTTEQATAFTDGTVPASEVRVASDPQGQSAVAVWTQIDAAAANIWVLRARYGGALGEAQVISDQKTNASAPAVGVDGAGHALVVWRQTWATGFRMMASVFDSTTGWSTAAIVADSGGAAMGKPSLAIEASGSAVVAWTQADATDANKVDVWVARHLAGRGFVPTASLSLSTSGAARADSTSAGIDSQGRAMVAWIEGGEPYVARLE